MDYIFDVIAENNIPFRAVVTKKSGKEAVVAFYDRRRNHTENGQFTGGSYYVTTFLDIQSGVNLYGGVNEWTLDGNTVLLVKNWIRMLGYKDILGVDLVKFYNETV